MQKFNALVKKSSSFQARYPESQMFNIPAANSRICDPRVTADTPSSYM
jgi:hypothetical protein